MSLGRYFRLRSYSCGCTIPLVTRYTGYRISWQLFEVKEANFSLYLIKLHAMKTMWESRYRTIHSSTAAVDRGAWSASRSGRFTFRTHCIGGWMGTRAGQNTVKRRKILLLPVIEPRFLDRSAHNQATILAHSLGSEGPWSISCLGTGHQYWGYSSFLSPSQQIRGYYPKLVHSSCVPYSFHFIID